MKRIIILYHSGVCNTKMVAEKALNELSPHFNTDIFSVEALPACLDFNQYDGMIIGFPTIHASPSPRMEAFMKGLERLEKPLPALLFSTCGFYSANALRIFAKMCILKNIIPVQSQSFRCAATDGTLLFPQWNFLFTHEKKLDEKVAKACSSFINTFKFNAIKARIPRFKLYSILNYPNKFMGKHLKFRIYLHKNKCIKCGQCIKNCPAGALVQDQENYPGFTKEKCENCYRCIHHCPKLALSLSKKKSPLRVLDDRTI